MALTALNFILQQVYQLLSPTYNEWAFLREGFETNVDTSNVKLTFLQEGGDNKVWVNGLALDACYTRSKC